MRHDYDHLIIGAGMSGEAAAQAIHQASPAARIGMIGAEADPPYDRPPLTKGLWKDAAEDSIWRPVASSGATLHLGRRAMNLDAAAHVVTDDQGDTYHYGTLLLATGGQPRRLPFEGDRVLAYRSLEDYRRVRALAQPGAHVVVIGGGFIGCEIAAALAMNQCRVTQVFPEAVLGERVYPPSLSRFVDGYYRERGIELRPGRRATGGGQRGSRVTVALDDGTTVEGDAVVAGLGIVLETALAESVGATVDNGIHVDDCMRTGVPDVFAAGDVANFPNAAVGRMRVEHENAAIATGRIAGLAMAGQPEPYTELPYFYSDLFDLGYEAVGRLDSRLDMVEDWTVPNREGVVYYLDAGHVRGVLLWNTWGQVDSAREVIAAPDPLDAERLRGRIRA